MSSAVITVLSSDVSKPSVIFFSAVVATSFVVFLSVFVYASSLIKVPSDAVNVYESTVVTLRCCFYLPLIDIPVLFAVVCMSSAIDIRYGVIYNCYYVVYHCYCLVCCC